MSTIWVQYGTQGRTMAKELLSGAGAQELLSRGMKVGLKPNLVLSKPSASGATTDPQVTAGIIEFLQDHGIADITIMESSWVGDSTKRAFEACGYNDIQKQYGVNLLDLKRDRTATFDVDGIALTLCRAPLEVDLLINVPVLKAHCQTKITCALKNLKGCIPDSEKRRYHTMGLHTPIAALNKALPQHLIVVDGIIGDLTFEEGGTPVQMGRVMAGRDPVAIDSYCAELLGYQPEDIDYIPLAQSMGVGSFYTQVIERNQGKGQSLQSVPITRRFQHRISEDQACSSCLGSLLHALQRASENGSPLPDAVVIGQGFQARTGSALGIGRCTKGYSPHVPGCPPSAADILRTIKEHCS